MLARACVTARGDLDADIYDRHADGLYRQALLTLGDAGMAEQVVCDVIVDECTRVPSSAGGAGDASYRLPVSAYRRCQELTCGRRVNTDPGAASWAVLVTPSVSRGPAGFPGPGAVSSPVRWRHSLRWGASRRSAPHDRG